MASTAEARAEIALPIETCWEKLRDLSRAVHYVPGLTGCTITTEQREGVGASRVVESAQAGAVNETVTQWREGQGFEIRLHKGDSPPFPFAEALFTYELVAQGEVCEIHTRMDYTLAYGVVGQLLDLLIVRRTMSKNIRAVAEGLAAYYERDEAHNKGSNDGQDR